MFGRKVPHVSSVVKLEILEFFHVIWAGQAGDYISTLSFQLQILRNFDWQANLLSINL